MGQAAISTDISQAQELRLAELLSTLSSALDLTEGQPPGHCVRCCWIGMHVGRRIGLNDRQLSDLYYTLLLKDLGCSSNAARICQLYLANDISFKHDFKYLNGSLPQVLNFVLSHTGVHAGFASRMKAVFNILQNGGEISRELIETRCQRGAEIALKLGFPESVARTIRYLDEHWDGSGKPAGVSGDDIPVLSQVALMAQVIDVFQTSGGPEAAEAEIRDRLGTWFAPYLAHVFLLVAKDEKFWTTLRSDQVAEAIFDLEPAQVIKLADEDDVDNIAAAFAEIVDSKSSFSEGHSGKVTLIADRIAERLGHGEAQRRRLGRAALLYDIGRLGISNAIVDKNGQLDEEEWNAIRRFPVESERILSSLSVFCDIAPIAAGHHEHLDGTGYPRGLSGDAIGFDTRIISAADMLAALVSERPHRPAIALPDALAVMHGEIGTKIDPECFSALNDVIDELEPRLSA